MNYLDQVVERQKKGNPTGIYSCCSSNEYVIRAAMRRAGKNNTPLLIEATANQVNQYGGYTGMTPLQFKKWVEGIAEGESYPLDMLILGGDHLGPLTFAAEDEQTAMEKAKTLVCEFAKAGFKKIHLDTSMLIGDDKPGQLTDETIARRSAALCKAAEEAFGGGSDPDERIRYVIGSEVPIPGGVQGNEDSVAVTSPEAYQATVDTFEKVYSEMGLGDVWKRVIAVVVQPGVEFGDNTVLPYNRARAEALIQAGRNNRMVFEGHSTDYQTPDSLRQMVEDGIAILKVGPALTFGLREGLFALAQMEEEMKICDKSDLRYVIERVMVNNPGQWQKYYQGNADELSYARGFSYSDRMRYYLPEAQISKAIRKLIENLKTNPPSIPLLRQYLPIQAKKVIDGSLKNDPEELIMDHIGDWIDEYYYATLR